MESKEERNGQNEYEFIMSLDKEEFIDSIFLTFCGRLPNGSEKRTFLKKIGKTSEKKKEKVILSVAFSPEGIRKNLPLEGISVGTIPAKLLLGLDGEQFVDYVYYWILGRKADFEGKKNCIKRLTEGESKESILFSIWKSQEGADRKVLVSGLTRICKKNNRRKILFSLPVVGRWFQTAYSVFEGKEKRLKQDFFCFSQITKEQISDLKKENEKQKIEIEKSNSLLTTILSRLDEVETIKKKLEEFEYKLEEFEYSFLQNKQLLCSFIEDTEKKFVEIDFAKNSFIEDLRKINESVQLLFSNDSDKSEVIIGITKDIKRIEDSICNERTQIEENKGVLEEKIATIWMESHSNQSEIYETQKRVSEIVEYCQNYSLEINKLKELDVDSQYIERLNILCSSIPTVWGEKERLKISSLAAVSSCFFNTNSGQIEIGDYTFSGSGVSILAGTHDKYLTGLLRRDAEYSEGCDIAIGEGVWLGSNSTILGPAKIGNNAVVAAGSVVAPNTTIPENTIFAGIPAKQIGFLPQDGLQALSAINEALNRNDGILFGNGWSDKCVNMYCEKKVIGHFFCKAEVLNYFKIGKYKFYFKKFGTDRFSLTLTTAVGIKRVFEITETEGCFEFEIAYEDLEEGQTFSKVTFVNDKLCEMYSFFCFIDKE